MPPLTYLCQIHEHCIIRTFNILLQCKCHWIQTFLFLVLINFTQKYWKSWTHKMFPSYTILIQRAKLRFKYHPQYKLALLIATTFGCNEKKYGLFDFPLLPLQICESRLFCILHQNKFTWPILKKNAHLFSFSYIEGACKC